MVQYDTVAFWPCPMIWQLLVSELVLLWNQYRMRYWFGFKPSLLPFIWSFCYVYILFVSNLHMFCCYHSRTKIAKSSEM